MTLTVVGAVVVVRSCKPSWRCTSDPENPGTNWCSTLTRTAAKSSGLVQAGPNYRTEAACLRICSTNAVAQSDNPPEPPLYVEKSFDLKTWTRCGEMEVTWNGEIEWRETNALNSACFYRTRLGTVTATPARN